MFKIQIFVVFIIFVLLDGVVVQLCFRTIKYILSFVMVIKSSSSSILALCI